MSGFPDDNPVPRKTSFGAHMIATADPGLPAALRRMLVLSDGHRDAATLATMMPGRDVRADLAELEARGLIETGSPASARPESAADSDADLPEGWESATDFMISRARQSLGVQSVDVIEALEHAQDPEAARHAMSQWYRAMRDSRGGRLQADVDRIKAAALLKSPSTD